MTAARVAAGSTKGVLLLDKPQGPTSHDAVRLSRRSLGERRIGHTGTLDPFATGLLILLVGPATRLAETFSSLEKRYRATVRLGEETDTCDLTGEVVRTESGADHVTRTEVEDALSRQLGPIQQQPPKYSAKKVDGVPAHRRVRRGETVVLAPSDVTVHALDLTRFEPPNLELDVRCSTGTYVRSIARDLGRELNLGGHLTALRRTAIGPYPVKEALAWEDLSDPDAAVAALVPTADGLGHVPRFELNQEGRALVLTGRAVDAPTLPADSPFPILALHGGSVLSVGEVRAGCFHPRKVFLDGA